MVLLFSSIAVASDFHIPDTLSPEAKKVMVTFSKSFLSTQSFPAKEDSKGWKALREKYIGYVEPLNQQVIKAFKPTLVEERINNIPVITIRPQNIDEQDKRLLIYLHGGAYTLFSAKSSLYNSVPLADKTGIRTLAIDYSTAPEKKWQTIVDEVVTVIKALYSKGYSNQSIGIIGDSAGGGLAIAAVLKLRDQGDLIPKALVLWSPWVDLTATGDSYQTLKGAEPTFTYNGLLKHAADAYAEPKDQKHPYVSPLYADFKQGFPATLIQGGTKELLLSDFVRLYQKMDQAHIAVKLDLYEGMWHVFQSHYALPEAKVALLKSAVFLISILGKSRVQKK